jgi:hypothetical protein
MAVVSAPDLALLRGDAGLIITVTDALLSDSVCLYRLNRSPMRGTAWGFDGQNSWKDRFIVGGIEIWIKPNLLSWGSSSILAGGRLCQLAQLVRAPVITCKNAPKRSRTRQPVRRGRGLLQIPHQLRCNMHFVRISKQPLSGRSPDAKATGWRDHFAEGG